MRKYEAKLFLEGKEVDFLGFNITASGNATAGGIMLRPVPSAFKLKAGTHLAIFYKSSVMDDYELLVDGYITTKSFVHPYQSIQYGFQAVGQRTKLIQYYLTDLKSNAFNDVINSKLANTNKMIEYNTLDGKLLNSIFKKSSLIVGLKEFLKSILNIEKKENKLGIDTTTINYLKQTKFIDRLRIPIEDKDIYKLIKTSALQSFIGNSLGQAGGNYSLFRIIGTLLSLIFYRMYEPICPPKGGAIDLLPFFHLQVPPKVNMIRATQVSGSENLMMKPTRTFVKATPSTLQVSQGAANPVNLQIAVYPEDADKSKNLYGEEKYKGMIINGFLDLPGKKSMGDLSTVMTEFFTRSAKYYHYAIRAQMFNLGNVNVPFFDPHLIVGLPVLVINPSGDHIVGTLEAVNHYWNVNGNAGTSANIDYCQWLSDAESVPHPWASSINTQASLKAVYEDSYNSEVVATDFKEYRKAVEDIERYYMKKNLNEVEFIEWKRRKNVWTLNDYKDTIKVSNEERLAVVEKYISECNELAKKGAAKYV